MDWVAQVLAGGGLLAGFVVAWKLLGTGLQQIIATQREAQAATNLDAAGLRTQLTELRADLAAARDQLEQLADELHEARIHAGQQRVLKHDAQGRVQAFLLERGLVRQLAEQHECTAIIQLLDRLDSVRIGTDGLTDPPRRLRDGRELAAEALAEHEADEPDEADPPA